MKSYRFIIKFVLLAFVYIYLYHFSKHKIISKEFVTILFLEIPPKLLKIFHKIRIILLNNCIRLKAKEIIRLTKTYIKGKLTIFIREFYKKRKKIKNSSYPYTFLHLSIRFSLLWKLISSWV